MREIDGASYTGVDDVRKLQDSLPYRPARDRFKIVIVDEYTGRFLADRSWEHGLHQAVEAKEGLDVTADRDIGRRSKRHVIGAASRCSPASAPS